MAGQVKGWLLAIRAKASSFRTRCFDFWNWLRGNEPYYQVPQRHPPRLLSIWGMSGHFLSQISIVIIICVLWELSVDNNGIAAVPDTPNPSFNSSGFHSAPFWAYSILWTTVPTWIMSLYAAFWSAMLDDLKDCQATLDLYKPERWDPPRQVQSSLRGRQSGLVGSNHDKAMTAGQTLLLDYRQVIPILDSWKAYKNRHYILAACMVIKSCLWAAGGLSANILSPASAPHEVSLDLLVTKFFDENAGAGVGNVSSEAALDIASAHLNYGASLIPWTTQDYSFLPFESRDLGAAGNLTGATEAYSATLDCVLITADDFLRNGTVQYEPPGLGGVSAITYNFTDRGCPVTTYNLVETRIPSYWTSWATTACSVDAGYHRFGIISGQYDSAAPFLMSNFTFMTCKPLYWRSNANIVVISGTNASGAVLDFTTGEASQILPFFRRRWIGDMPLYMISDPTSLSSTDEFGRLVYAHNMKISPDDPFNSTLVAQSFTEAFRAVFANFVSTAIYQPTGDIKHMEGTRRTLQNRLFVVPYAAVSVIVLVALAFITTLVLAVWLFVNRDILARHSDRILGHAILARNNHGLETYINEVEGSVKKRLGIGVDITQCDLVKQAANDERERLYDWKCWIDDDGLHVEMPRETVPSSPATESQASQGGSSDLQLVPQTVDSHPGTTS